MNERDKEIEDLLLQIRLLKEELEHRQELIPQGQPAVHKTTVNGAILPEQVHTASINPTSRYVRFGCSMKVNKDSYHLANRVAVTSFVYTLKCL